MECTTLKNIIDLIKWIMPIGTMYLGLVLGLKKYRHEKLWDEKHSSYIEIINSMNTILLYSNENYKMLSLLPSVSTEKLQELKKENELALLNLKTHVNIGSIIMPDKISSRINSLMSTINEELFQLEEKAKYIEQNSQAYIDLLADHYNSIQHIIENILSEILILMKKDLS